MLIDAVKGLADGNTFLYMNREGRRYLKELKNTKLSMAPGDTGYNTVVSDWDGIPVYEAFGLPVDPSRNGGCQGLTP